MDSDEHLEKPLLGEPDSEAVRIQIEHEKDALREREESFGTSNPTFAHIDTTVRGSVEEIEIKAKSKLKLIPHKKHHFKEWWVGHGLVTVITVLWGIVNAILFIEAANRYWNNPNYFITIARGFGQLLNFNCALILIPVMRNILTALRKTWIHKFFPWDANIRFHRQLAWWIAFCGTMHGGAHYLNYRDAADAGDLSVWDLGYKTLAGWTGHAISIVMIFMYTTAQESIKRNHFNWFYLFHHLFLAFYVFLFFHGPRFKYWLVGPAVLYLCERLLREYRGHQSVSVLSTIKHPSDVLEVRFQKPHFKYRCGQYLYLNCPYISKYEWHPFTISSSPMDEYVSVHIRCVGPWTRAFDNLVGPANVGDTIEVEKNEAPDGSPLLRVDGPFGSASEDVFNYKVAFLCGAGIGVTPFASILKTISYHLQDPILRSKMKLRKVYFFWISREHTAFEWFGDLLQRIEKETKNLGYFLEINIYLTGRFKQDQIRDLYAKKDDMDTFTHLESKTNFGRPRWDTVFSALRNRHRQSKIGVFFCGPPPVGKALQKSSRKFSKQSNIYGVTFVYHKENF